MGHGRASFHARFQKPVAGEMREMREMHGRDRNSRFSLAYVRVTFASCSDRPQGLAMDGARPCAYFTLY